MLVSAVALVVLSACAATDERNQYIEWTHAQITENLDSYNKMTREKALAGCVNWEASFPNNIDVRHLNSAFTAVGSDGPIFTGSLMASALANCNKARRASSSDCTCISIDTMGRPGFDIPDTFLEELRLAGVLAAEGGRLEARRLLEDGRAAYQRSDYDQAIGNYDEAIRLKPDYARAFYHRGNAYRQKGAYDRALADYDKAIRLDSGYASPYNGKGLAFYGQDEYDRAIESYDEAIRLEPDFAWALKNRGNALRSKGAYGLAINDYDAALRLDPDYVSALYNRGNAYYSMRQYDSAIRDYTAAIRLEPEHASAYNARGISYRRKGVHNRAIEDYTQAIRLEPEYATAFGNRCWVYGLDRKAEEALRDCNESLRLRPDQVSTLNARALAHWHLGDFGKARQDLERAREIDPSFPTWTDRFREFEDMFPGRKKPQA